MTISNLNFSARTLGSGLGGHLVPAAIYTTEYNIHLSPLSFGEGLVSNLSTAGLRTGFLHINHWGDLCCALHQYSFFQWSEEGSDPEDVLTGWWRLQLARQ